MPYKNKRDEEEWRKRWREKNPERNKKHCKQWRKTHPEYSKQHLKKNRENIYIYHRQWAKTEKGKMVKQRGNVARQVRNNNIVNTLTSQEWLDILEEYNYRCAYCNIEFDENILPTKDHIIPISRGGHNIKENVVPACQSCNSKKSNKIISVVKGS